MAWRLAGLLLVLPALATADVRSPSPVEAALPLLAVLAAGLFVGSNRALRWLAVLNPLGRTGRANAAQLRIVSTEGWLPAADGMLDQAVADRRPLSMALVELHDLPELHQLFGRGMANRVLARVSRQLHLVAGGKGLAVRTSATQFTLVLPGLEAGAVRLALNTVFGEVCCIEDDGGFEEMVLLPRFAVVTLTEGDASVTQGHARLCAEIAGTWCDDRLAPLSVPRDEQPGPLSAAAERHPVRPVYEPTVPLPMR